MIIPEENLPRSIEEFRRHYIRSQETEGWLEVTINGEVRWQHLNAIDVFEQMKEVAKRQDRGVYVMDIDFHNANRRFPF